MDQCSSVEGSENHVHLPVDLPEERGHTEGKSHVPGPVRCRGERDGLSTNLSREDLRWIGPRDRAPGCSEGRNEQVRAGDNAFGGGWVALDDPGDLL